MSLGRRGGVTEYGYLMSKALRECCDVAAISSAGAENRERWPELGDPASRGRDVHGRVHHAALVAGVLAIREHAHVRARVPPGRDLLPGRPRWKPILGFILPRSAITVLTVHDPELHRGEDTLSFRLLAAVNRLRVYGYVLLNESQRQAFIDAHDLPPTSVAVIPHGAFDGFVDAVAPLTTFGELG